MCLPASGACVRRARARLTPKADQTQQMHPRQPDVFRTAAAAALAQEKPTTQSQTCPPRPPTAKTYSQGATFEGFQRCRGCRGCKGCWNAQRCWRGCWRLSGAICTIFAVFLKVWQRGIRSPSQGQGGRGCFGAHGLRAGDAGDAEEELGVQQNTSAVYPGFQETWSNQ